MPILFLGFAVAIIIIGVITAILMWHWKTYMPEQGKGLGVFTVYMVGLAILIMALFTSITTL
jgi:hypothetical protein